jgi:hypothetical protein
MRPCCVALFYFIRPTNCFSLVNPHWEIDDLKYAVFPNPGFKRFCRDFGSLLVKPALPPSQQFKWICEKQHHLKMRLEADTLNQLGELMKAKLSSECILDENTLRYGSSFVHKSLFVCTGKLLCEILMRMEYVLSAEFDWSTKKFEIFVSDNFQPDERFRDANEVTIKKWGSELVKLGTQTDTKTDTKLETRYTQVVTQLNQQPYYTTLSFLGKLSKQGFPPATVAVTCCHAFFGEKAPANWKNVCREATLKPMDRKGLLCMPTGLQKLEVSLDIEYSSSLDGTLGGL